MKVLINGSMARTEGNFKDATVLYFELILFCHIGWLKVDWNLSVYEIDGEQNNQHMC